MTEGLCCDKCNESLVEQGDYYYTVPIVIKNAPGGAYEDELHLCEECFEKWVLERRRWTW